LINNNTTTMPEVTEADPTDPRTRRPKAQPLTAKGDHFEPMKLLDFSPEIYLLDYVSPEDPISLFIMYYPPAIIEYIVQITNLNPREPRNLEYPYTRVIDWQSISTGEIYIYFAICIYMTLHVENEIADYWNISRNTPFYLISKHITRNRF
jgi:hypothetical protein